MVKSKVSSFQNIKPMFQHLKRNMFYYRLFFVWDKQSCVHDGTVPIFFLCADDQEWESLDLCQCIIPFLTSSTGMHPTIPINTMLCPEYHTASCDANLSRERQSSLADYLN